MSIENVPLSEVDTDDRDTVRAVPVCDAKKPLYGFLSRLATKEPISSLDVDEGIARHTIKKSGPRRT